MGKVLGFTKDVNDLEVGSIPSQRTMNFLIFLSLNNLFYKFNFVLKIILFLNEKLWVFGPLKFLKFFIIPLKSELFSPAAFRDFQNFRLRR